MKNTNKSGFVGITFALLTVCLMAVLGSCNNVLSLGEKLNLNGPVVTITAPVARQPVDGKFVMEGTVKDKTGLDRMIVKVRYPQETSPGSGKFVDADYVMQWRYTPAVGWEVSTDSGMTWGPVDDVDVLDENGIPIPESAEWDGTDESGFTWKLPIDLGLPGSLPPDSQYLFTVTAWNPAGYSDANSFKSRTVTLFKAPPLVSIITPFLYPSGDAELDKLEALVPSDENRQNPLYLGKFLNGPVTLQWQIDSPNEVWSIDIRFYDKSEVPESSWDISMDPEIPLASDNYVYRIDVNADEARPANPNPNDTVKFNGRAIVPDLSVGTFGPTYVSKDPITGQGGYTHEQKELVSDKTTLYAVVLCMDAAGHVLKDDNFKGYFIYWPQSDIPWLTLPDGLMPFYGAVENIYTAFPETEVPVRAFDDDGIAKVEYTIYSISDGTASNVRPAPESLTPLPGYPKTVTNTTNSRAFSWSFDAPVEAGDYYVEADAFDVYGLPSPVVSGWFEVKDVSFPDISPPTTPVASDPLFKYIKGAGVDNWQIEIVGKASDFTGLQSVQMVWINPHSVNYAAMSQLSYFRDGNYGKDPVTVPGTPPRVFAGGDYGWYVAPVNANDTYGLDTYYSEEYPNKVWTMDITTTPRVHNSDTNRWEYTYKKTLNLKTDLNIAPGQDTYDYLKSQVFVLKATDVDGAGKSTIITWAPQGDSEAPKVKITRVTITNPAGTSGNRDFMQRETGGVYDPINGIFPYRIPLQQFVKKDASNIDVLTANDIIIEGTWEEDSAGSLDIIQSELKNNLIVTIGSKDNELTAGTSLTVVPHTTKTLTPASGTAVSGTWTATGRLGLDPSYTLVASALKDTLVVSAILTDIGGNISEDGASWLIESDDLRFLRAGSDTGDGTYSYQKDGDPVDIDIFLEFNKPVSLVTSLTELQLLDPGNKEQLPKLVLNSGTETSAVAYYNPNHPDQHEDKDPTKPIVPSSRQHFTYRVANGQSTGAASLNLTNLLGGSGGVAGDSQYNASAYPYIWKTQAGEEIRMVMSTKTGTSYKLGILPVTTDPNAPDYLYTLAAGKHITIDTTPPTLVSLVKNARDGWYGKGNYLYFTATFNKEIKIGAVPPALVMNLKKKGIDGDIRTTAAQKINNTQAVFSYQIQDDDYTPGAGDTASTPVYGGYLQIKGLDGNITDMAQNAYNPAGGDFTQTIFDGLHSFPTSPPTPLGTLQVKAVKPPTPTLNVMSGVSTIIGSSGGDSYTWNPKSYDDSDAFDAAFPETSTDIVRLKTLYIDNLYIQITPTGTSGPDYDRIEYSVNYGKDWPVYNTPYATPKQQTAPGRYDLTARQIDMAGNVSDWSKPVTLNWDKGDLLTRITSSYANGIYTNNTGIGGLRADVIPITLYFRKPVVFITDPIFELSAVDGGGSKKQLQPARPVGAVSTFTFDYPVGASDTTNGQPLNLERIVSISATDGDVDVTSLINLTLAAAQNTLLKDLKNIVIQTGAPIRTVAPYFYNDTTRPNYTVQTSPNFQGVKDEDDSYWTTLGMEFDRDIYKSGAWLWGGSAYDVPNVITIIQKADGYRIPAVLTEAQWSRYNTIPNIGKFYTKGTNGYKVGIGADTSVKYILNFDQDTYNIVPNGSAAAGTIEKFAEDFRQAEKIELPINSSQIELYNSPSGVSPEVHRVTVRLSSSNALKVPGASYEVNFPAGFVQDLLGNPCVLFPNKDPSNGDVEDGTKSPPAGVSRPFMRISTPQEKISVADGLSGRPTAGASQPWFYVAAGDRAGTANLRMDSRTPGSVVRYVETGGDTTSTNNLANDNADWSTSSPDVTYGPGNDPGQPALPSAASASFGRTDLGPVLPRSIGSAATNNIYQGYRLRIRARGAVGSTLSDAASEEVLYRSVLTFKGTSTQSGQSRLSFNDGDSVWVRGGDTLYGATIPGFPLSSADDFFALSNNKQRAGIRLMTRVNSDSTTLANSTWQWVTWEIKAIAYIGVYLGRDTTTDAARAYQYGPLMAASQTGNWSMAKQSYALQPGGHRWLNSSAPDYTNYKGSNTPPFTWVTAFDQRPPNGDGTGNTLNYTIPAQLDPYQ